MSLELSCAACEVQVPPVRDGSKIILLGFIVYRGQSLHSPMDSRRSQYAVSITLAAMGWNDQAALKSKWHYYS